MSGTAWHVEVKTMNQSKQEILPSRAWVMETLLGKWNFTPESELIPVEQACGRVLAEPACSQCTIPVVRASSMDGVGVVSAMFADGIPDMSRWTLGNEFVRADTGDDFDDKYDAVIPIERVKVGETCGLILDEDVVVTPGMGIRPKGSTLKEGELLLEANVPLRPVDLSALVMGGVTQVQVYRKPRVAFIPTGSELIEPGAEMTRGKVYDSNSILAQQLLIEMGAEPVMFPIVRDNMTQINDVFEQAMKQADIVIINGGSSKGSEDYNARLLAERGEVLCHGVAAAPGRPMCVALVDNKPAINLPGPPVALFYGMDWIIRSLICKATCIPFPKRPTVTATVTEDIKYGKTMEILCKMDVIRTENGYETYQIPFKGSNGARALCSDAMYITDPETNLCPKGSVIEIKLLRGEEYLGR